jgi:pantoate--beta-alanine ligase
MQIFKGIDSTQTFISEEKKQSKRIGLVPTMGALHRGHLSLVAKSKVENDTTITSIFVNPIQFNNPSDLSKYPRTLEQDLKLLEESGCKSVFIPAPEEMYKKPVSLSLNFGDLDKIMEGKFRPGHFSGVGIVVSKLFNIIQPDIAYFGQKDYQQFLIIKQIVDDLIFHVQLRCEEIVREPDGLAMSSRNMRLSKDERAVAPVLFQTLMEAKEALSQKSLAQLKNDVIKKTSRAGVKIEYLELAHRENLQILHEYDNSIPSILLIAAFVGDVRLIDNMFV